MELQIYFRSSLSSPIKITNHTESLDRIFIVWLYVSYTVFLFGSGGTDLVWDWKITGVPKNIVLLDLKTIPKYIIIRLYSLECT